MHSGIQESAVTLLTFPCKKNISSYYPILSSSIFDVPMFEASHCGGQTPGTQSRGGCGGCSRDHGVSLDLRKALPDAGQKPASYTKEDCPSPSMFLIFVALLNRLSRSIALVSLLKTHRSGGFGDRNTDSP